MIYKIYLKLRFQPQYLIFYCFFFLLSLSAALSLNQNPLKQIIRDVKSFVKERENQSEGGSERERKR